MPSTTSESDSHISAKISSLF